MKNIEMKNVNIWNTTV